MINSHHAKAEKMKRTGIPIAALSALATLVASLGAPHEMNGQMTMFEWEESAPHITIAGQVELGSPLPEAAKVQCVLCSTPSCSLETPESNRVFYDVDWSPYSMSIHSQHLNIQTGQSAYDYEFAMTIGSEEMAGAILSYACQLLVGDTPVGPGAPYFQARPREGTPFTGLVTGLIP